MPNIKINNVNFHYELHGQGPSLILVNGYTSDLTAWIPIVKLLKNDFQILIFDNQGVGNAILGF